MNGRSFPLFLMAMMVCAWFPATAKAQESELSSERIDLLDQRGYFTPAFKAAVHDLVDTQRGIEEAKAAEAKLMEDLPDLQKQATEADAKAAALHKEFARYDHPEESDFTALQGTMNDANAKPEDQMAVAQAFVWSYPGSMHLAEAQQDLQKVQKSLADQQQALKDAEAARLAAHAKLIQRAQARDLSLDEWKDFLRDMTQEDILKLLGRPVTAGPDYWLYTGAWTTDPYTGQKVGLEINFNGTRVNGVSVGQPAQ